MKDIMGNASSRHFQGVALMGYSDVSPGPSLFEADLIPGLQRELLSFFAGRELSVGQIFRLTIPKAFDSSYGIIRRRSAYLRVEARSVPFRTQLNVRSAMDGPRWANR